MISSKILRRVFSECDGNAANRDFPALSSAGCINLRCVMIGLFECLRLLSLAKMS